MKSRALIIIFCMTTLAAAWGYGRYYPVELLKIYAEFRASDCSVCSVKKLDRAAAGLDKLFTPGLVIDAGAAGLVKTSACGENEVQLSEDMKRKLYTMKDDEPVYYPAVVFRFHTKERNMSGIDEKNYSHNKYDSVYDRGSSFTGKIKLVLYAHGDGRTFVYDRERHLVQVHCKVLNMK